MNYLIFRDAPLRTAIEMVLRGYGQGNYVISNEVVGLITLQLPLRGLEETLTQLCQKSTPALEWRKEAPIVFVQPREKGAATAASQEALMARFMRAQLPQTEGIPCRMAGCFLQGNKALAILELGNPPDSRIDLVELGAKTEFLGSTYEITGISEKSMLLKGAGRTLKIPLAGLGERREPTKLPLATKKERALLADAPLISVLELIAKSGGPLFQFEGLPECYLSGETNTSLSSLLMRSATTPLSFTKTNGVWQVKARGEARPTPPRFVSLDDVKQGRAQLPVIYGAPRRVAAVVLGTRPLALLETGNPPETQRTIVAEGERLGGLRVAQIGPNGVVLEDGSQRFLVPLTPLAPVAQRPVATARAVR